MDGFDVIDPRFKAFVLPNAPLEKLGDGLPLAAKGRCGSPTTNACCSAICRTTACCAGPRSGGVSVFRAAVRLRQRSCARPRRAADRLLAPRPLHHAHRTRRARHRAGRSLSRQAAQLAQRHRRQVRRHDLVHRSALRHPDRLRRRQADVRVAGRRSTASIRATATLTRGRGRFRGAERPVLLPGRARALRRRERRCSSRPIRAATSASSTLSDGWRAPVDGRRLPQGRAGLCRRVPLRRGRQSLDECGRRRALHRSGRRAARQDPRAVTRSRTCPSADATAAACSSAPRTRCTPSTPTRAARSGHECPRPCSACCVLSRTVSRSRRGRRRSIAMRWTFRVADRNVILGGAAWGAVDGRPRARADHSRACCAWARRSLELVAFRASAAGSVPRRAATRRTCGSSTSPSSVSDIDAAYIAVCADTRSTPISEGGPQRLPRRERLGESPTSFAIRAATRSS